MRSGSAPHADLSMSPSVLAIDESRLETIGIEASIRAHTEIEMSAEIGGLPPSCEALRLPRNALIARTMNPTSHDFVTVDMRGLKAALVARAQVQRVSVSVLVRGAVERELGLVDATIRPDGAMPAAPSAGSIVKLSIRLTSVEADLLCAGARRAGLSRGAFLAGLLAGVPALWGGTDSRPDCLATLTASSAELSSLARNVHHLTALLCRGEVQAAQQYRRSLDTLSDDVRAHLSLAARVLADLRPVRLPSASKPTRRPKHQGDRHGPST